MLTIEETGPGTVTSSPAGIACGSTCSQKFLVGTTVTLSAAPAPGALFDGWAGGGCKGILSCTVTINGDTTVAAEFEPRPAPDAVKKKKNSAPAAPAGRRRPASPRSRPARRR